MLILGLDPSLHKTGWCTIQKNSTIHSYGTFTVSSKFTGMEAMQEMFKKSIKGLPKAGLLVCEVQQYRHGHGEKMTIENLLNLHAMCCALFLSLDIKNKIACTPQRWKGTLPKKIQHARLCEKYNCLKTATSDEKDAAGIALWGLNEYNRRR